MGYSTLRAIDSQNRFSEIPVLDKGFVRLVDFMGSDMDVVLAARTSVLGVTNSDAALNETDINLLRFLMRHRHTTPFEMVELKFHVRVPMDCWRQWIRHRMASVNEYSTRYAEAIDARQETPPDMWREQKTTNRQGSGEFLPEEVGSDLTRNEKELHLVSDITYRDRLSKGVAREQARKDLPLSTYTEAYWKIDLHNLLHFLGLRMAPDAQIEIRSYANQIAEYLKYLVPHTWRAFEDYRLNAITFSAVDLIMLKARMKNEDLLLGNSYNYTAREIKEFEEKMQRLESV